MDEEIRSLFRSAATQPGKRPELLQALVRTGALGDHQLKAAAYGGDLAARALCPVGLKFGDEGIDGWIGGVGEWGYQACAAVGLSALRLGLTRARQDARLEVGIAALGEWVACPCEEHADHCEDAFVDVMDVAREAEGSGDTPLRCLAGAASALSLVVDRSKRVNGTVEFAVQDLRASIGWLHRLGVSSRLMLDAMRQALVAWALASVASHLPWSGEPVEVSEAQDHSGLSEQDPGSPS